MKEPQSPTITVETLNTSLLGLEERITAKMMQGFEAFDKRLAIFETSTARNFKILSGQIQHLVMTKADWPEEA